MPSATTSQAVPSHPALRRHLARPHVGFIDPTTEPSSWVESPNGLVTIILNVGHAFGGHPTAFIAGLSDTYDVIRRDGPIECLDLKLTPPGAHRLLSMPLRELTGNVVTLGDVLGPPAGAVIDRLRATRGWAARAELFDNLLLRGLEHPTGPDPRVEWAWSQIMLHKGGVSVRGLAQEIGWSQGHFIRRFHQQLGLTPKKLARIVRFNAVLRASVDWATPDGHSNWAGLAAAHGYADQSHLIRDVREFTGTSPTDLDALD